LELAPNERAAVRDKIFQAFDGFHVEIHDEPGTLMLLKLNLQNLGAIRSAAPVFV
jgi:hypothetical protein